MNLIIYLTEPYYKLIQSTVWFDAYFALFPLHQESCLEHTLECRYWQIDINEGQKLTVEFENNLSSMIEAMNLDDEERIDAEIIEADFIEKE